MNNTVKKVLVGTAITVGTGCLAAAGKMIWDMAHEKPAPASEAIPATGCISEAAEPVGNEGDLAGWTPEEEDEEEMDDTEYQGTVEEILNSELFSTDHEAEGTTQDHGEPRIYEIAEEEYGADDCEGSTLTWYQEDGVLADEMDEVVPDPAKIIGAEGLKALRNGSPYLCIRNEQLGLDYGICAVDKAYREAVLGEPPTDGEDL